MKTPWSLARANSLPLPHRLRGAALSDESARASSTQCAGPQCVPKLMPGAMQFETFAVEEGPHVPGAGWPVALRTIDRGGAAGASGFLLKEDSPDARRTPSGWSRPIRRHSPGR